MDGFLAQVSRKSARTITRLHAVLDAAQSVLGARCVALAAVAGVFPELILGRQVRMDLDAAGNAGVNKVAPIKGAIDRQHRVALASLQQQSTDRFCIRGGVGMRAVKLKRQLIRTAKNLALHSSKSNAIRQARPHARTEKCGARALHPPAQE